MKDRDGLTNSAEEPEPDNGTEIRNCRTQFMKSLVEFADRHRVELERVYLSPYHSKYNPIEWCWSVFEQHWNGTLLSLVSHVLQWLVPGQVLIFW
ncbi:MAG: hypothetical protein C0467_29510 [Planctomycetaceae bacterium]|nr:hypothetical protein [Planctomycetaceae bacterium]